MSAVLGRLHRDEGGQALVLVAIFLIGMVAVAGLVADGGMVLAQRRDLQNVADAAAAGGAMQLDESLYRASGGTEVALDAEAAYDTAISYLGGEAALEYAVAATEDGVAVEVSRGATTAFLRVLGIESVTISARASAEPRHGVFGAVRE